MNESESRQMHRVAAHGVGLHLALLAMWSPTSFTHFVIVTFLMHKIWVEICVFGYFGYIWVGQQARTGCV